MALGYEFQPDQEKRLRTGINQLSPFASQALQILSLRLPNFLGGSPISPDELLRSQMGGRGGGGSSVVQSLLNAGASVPTGSNSSSETSQLSDVVNGALTSPAPVPHITPGVDTATPPGAPVPTPPRATATPPGDEPPTPDRGTATPPSGEETGLPGPSSTPTDNSPSFPGYEGGGDDGGVGGLLNMLFGRSRNTRMG